MAYIDRLLALVRASQVSGGQIGAAQSLTGSGSADLTHHTTILTTGGAGADAVALADAAAADVGKQKQIVIAALGAPGDTSVITFTGGSVTLSAVGDGCTLEWNGAAWAIIEEDLTGLGGTGSVTGSTAAGSTATMAVETNLAPPTAGVAVHAQIIDNATSPVTTGITNPERPRNLVYTFGAAWGGGNPTITGTDQDDAAVTETPVVNLGSTRTGTKIFKTVTSIAFAAGAGGGTHSLDIATGDKLGILAPFSAAVGLASVDGVEDLATFDATLHQRGFTPVSKANGSKNYAVTVPSTAATHTHAAGTLAGPSHRHPHQ